MEKLFSFSLFGLGIFFIYMGDVIPRYQIGQTNFAVYQETMKELPTIVTYITKVPNNFTLGVDFNLTLYTSFESFDEGNTMSLGKNHIGSGVNVYFEHLVPEQLFDDDGDRVLCFRITPLNFPLAVPHYFKLNYSFSTQLPMARIALYITAENNSLGCFGDRHYDGETTTVVTKGGNWVTLKLQPRKYLYLQKEDGCRESPYTEELITQVEAHFLQQFKSLCRPKDIF